MLDDDDPPVPVIPEFEPEVVAVATRNARSFEDRTPTTILQLLDYDGVRLTSRYGKAAEYRSMIEVLRLLDASARRLIRFMDCDSKCDTYRVDLAPGCAGHAPVLGWCISNALREVCGGHNGLYIHDPAVPRFCHEVGADWGECDHPGFHRPRRTARS